MSEGWAQKIAEADGRPHHPEDYAGRLVGLPDPEGSFAEYGQTPTNLAIHTDMWYSFMDWFEYEVEGRNHIKGRCPGKRR